MTKTITAIYENGVLKPTEKLDLPEHAQVEILLTDVSAWRRELDALLARIHQKTASYAPEEIERDITEASRQAQTPSP
jgi:predicted DNA-binding antitoxin AbrB/MazE fold protein